jgi:hypothetical protein
MWQSLEAGVVGAFPQCPVGLQHREFANMKYWEHETHPPHNSVTTSSSIKPIFANALNTITPLPSFARSPGLDAHHAAGFRRALRIPLTKRYLPSFQLNQISATQSGCVL